MGIDLNFFTKPILIPCTFIRTEVEAEEFREIKETVYFSFRRETKGDTDNAAILKTIGGEVESVRLARFCSLLCEEPKGVLDFPSDSRPLFERAKEYFSPEFWRPAIQIVMGRYDQLLYPVELYDGF